jgi:hypothetical protein
MKSVRVRMVCARRSAWLIALLPLLLTQLMANTPELSDDEGPAIRLVIAHFAS